MPQNKITILSTREIEQALIDDAAEKNILIDVSPFIKTEPIQSIEVQQEVESTLLESLTVVFTSVNAVEAVATELEGQHPDWKIYCIGYATKQAIEKYFGKGYVAGIAINAETLADLIIEESEDDEVYFFCGDQRRTELTDKLGDNGILVNEIVVYQTIDLPHKIEKNYNGILFFSPSAVNSYFQTNKINDDMVLFAIGNTTAAEIKKHATNKIVVSEQSVKRSLVENAISFYQQNSIYH